MGGRLRLAPHFCVNINYLKENTMDTQYVKDADGKIRPKAIVDAKKAKAVKAKPAKATETK